MKVEADTYHADCYKCNICGGAYQGMTLGEDANLVCKQCDPRLKPTCPGCSLKVTGGAVFKVGDDTYHGECYKCNGCGGAYQGMVLDDGKLMCANCRGASNAPICPICSEKCLAGSSVFKVGEDTYHVECYKCNGCGGAYQGMVLGEDKRLLCSNCHGASNAPICPICSKDCLAGSSVFKVGDDTYHVECYKCNGCGGAYQGMVLGED